MVQAGVGALIQCPVKAVAAVDKGLGCKFILIGAVAQVLSQSQADNGYCRNGAERCPGQCMNAI